MTLRKRVRACAAVAIVLSLAACSEPSDTTATGGSPSPGIEKADEKDAREQRGSKNRSEIKKDRTERDPKNGRSSNGERGEGAQGAVAAKERSTDRGDREAAAPVYPSPGKYSFEQRGYERFCQSASCERSDLPPNQTVRARYERRSGDGAVIVSEARVSSRTTNRTTFAFARSGAWITHMETSFSNQGFDYTSGYDPRPPIRALRLPLQTGDRWSGTWEGDVSGTYRVRIAGTDDVEVGGRVVRAFRIEFAATFRGEAKGESSGVNWVDPDTNAIVRSEGTLHAENAFGTYETEFTTVLRSGPGY